MSGAAVPWSDVPLFVAAEVPASGVPAGVTGVYTERLRAAVRARDRADADVALGVMMCRDAGVTWAQVGALLGVTKQAAQQRYAHRTW